MKKNTITFSLLGFFTLFVLAPYGADAAVVYLEGPQSKIMVGDTVVLKAKINAEGVTLNTVDGEVAMYSGNGLAEVKEFSLAHSAFGLWPRTPSLSSNGQVISFIGGVPGGFNIEGATLFSIVIEAKKEGTLKIRPQNVSVFANDGNGTKVPVTLKGIEVQVGPRKAGSIVNDEWKTLVANDIASPEDFIIVLGQSDAVNNGKKFAYFSAVDNQTGIAYYEVSENGKDPVRSGSTYELTDQSGDVKLEVTAFDKAGNKKVAYYPTNQGGSVNWFFVLTVSVALFIVRALYRKFKK